MSNTARKARKRDRRDAMSAEPTMIETTEGRSIAVRPSAARPFLHPKKVGTPVPDREANQVRPQMTAGAGLLGSRRTAAGRKRIAEYDARQQH